MGGQDYIRQRADFGHGLAAGLLIGGDWFSQDMSCSAIHFDHVCESGIYENGFVTVMDQPDVQGEILHFCVVTAMKGVISGDLANAVAQRINSIFRGGRFIFNAYSWLSCLT